MADVNALRARVRTQQDLIAALQEKIEQSAESSIQDLPHQLRLVIP